MYNRDVTKAIEDSKGDAFMTRLELLTLLLSIQALLESDNADKAREIIAKVIAEAERNDTQGR